MKGFLLILNTLYAAFKSGLMKNKIQEKMKPKTENKNPRPLNVEVSILSVQ